jgi:hypothetical protein
MLIARCATFPRQCLTAVTLDKPRVLVGDLGWAYGLRQLPPDLDILVSAEIGDSVKTELTRRRTSSTRLGSAHSSWRRAWSS